MTVSDVACIEGEFHEADSTEGWANKTSAR
jgi:hypothetical protein